MRSLVLLHALLVALMCALPASFAAWDPARGVRDPHWRWTGSPARAPSSSSSPSSSVAARAFAERLVANMTLLEKARALDMHHGYEVVTNGVLNETAALDLLRKGGMGIIHDLYPPESAWITNRLQELALNVTGIPILFVEECLHGLGQRDHTIFPNPNAMAASFDPTLVRKIAAAIAAEARSYGIRMCFSPVLGPGREPRWGRQEELFSEDPYLVSVMGYNYILGMQGVSPSNETVSCTAKHFAAHSVPEGGRNTAPAHVGVREMNSVFLAPFRAAVKDAGCLGIMSAYSEADGIPCSANEYLLTDRLRNEYTFEGIVISDLGAVSMLIATHATAQWPYQAIGQFLSAGGNSQFYDFPHDVWDDAIVNSVLNGSMSSALLDERVVEMIAFKHRLRLFEQPFTDEHLAGRVNNAPEHRALALEAAVQGMVLLKNDKGVLPLSGVPPLTVIGQSAYQHRWADYSGGGGNVNNGNAVSLLRGLYDELGRDADITPVVGVNTMSADEWIPVHRTYLQTDDGHEGLAAEYFTNEALQGKPHLKRVDAEVNFQWYQWAYAGWGANLTDAFSVRWTGTLTPDTSCTDMSTNCSIRLSTSGNRYGGGRLFVNGELLIDVWNCTTERSETTSSCVDTAPFAFKRGVPIRLVVEARKVPNTESNTILSWNLVSDDGISNAVSAAKRVKEQGGVAILALGDSVSSSGEGHDTVTLRLPGRQVELAQRVFDTGVTAVVVCFSGRATALPVIATRADAIIQAFALGQAEGTALAQILFGHRSPSGRLPFTLPPAVGMDPLFYDHKPSAWPQTYVDAHVEPLFPFGYGLTYTRFEFSNFSLSPSTIQWPPSRPDEEEEEEGVVSCTFRVTNIGNRSGVGVPQLYVRDVISSVTTPVVSLRGFSRTEELAPNATETVTILLHLPEDLWLFNKTEQWAVEPGEFIVFVGHNAEHLPLNATLTVVTPHTWPSPSPPHQPYVFDLPRTTTRKDEL